VIQKVHWQLHGDSKSTLAVAWCFKKHIGSCMVIQKVHWQLHGDTKSLSVVDDKYIAIPMILFILFHRDTKIPMLLTPRKSI